MSDAARFCVNCGERLESGAAFCHQCGHPVAGQSTEEQAASQAVGGAPVGGYLVSYDVERQTDDRNRLTVGFRLILGFPQWLLVGGPGGAGISFPGDWRGGWFGLRSILSAGAGGGVLGLAAWVMAVLSWFAIVFAGKQPRGLWDFTDFFMRWRGNAVAYMALLRDDYPPFGPGDGRYPATFRAADFPETRDRLSVGLRLIYAIPQIIVLFFLGIAWVVTVIIAWFAILFTGRYPEGLYTFGVGYMRWSLRVQAYLLLMRDEYPPFSLD